MKYTLYIGNNCHQCAEVVKYMEDNMLEFKKINVDESDSEPPIPIFAFPALFEEKELIGYGTDIIHYFQKVNKQ